MGCDASFSADKFGLTLKTVMYSKVILIPPARKVCQLIY